MTDKPPEPEDDAPDVRRRFEETLARLVNTPHKPHKPAAEKPAAKREVP